MHNFSVEEKLVKIMAKLSKKDNSLYSDLFKKINGIINCDNINHYKNLRYDMKDSKRVHIGHFVLVFRCFAIQSMSAILHASLQYPAKLAQKSSCQEDPRLYSATEQHKVLDCVYI